MSEKINDGGPAFPTPGEVFTTDAQGRTCPQSAWGIDGKPGMSLRDYFAGQALAGLLDPVSMAAARMNAGPDSITLHLSQCAYAFADAMLRARGGGNG